MLKQAWRGWLLEVIAADGGVLLTTSDWNKDSLFKKRQVVVLFTKFYFFNLTYQEQVKLGNYRSDTVR